MAWPLNRNVRQMFFTGLAFIALWAEQVTRIEIKGNTSFL